jgi:hypothetical protein
VGRETPGGEIRASLVSLSISLPLILSQPLVSQPLVSQPLVSQPLVSQPMESQPKGLP